MISQNLLEELLEKVVKPGQYLGNEWGARRKPFASAQVRLALAFPDIYELGMSNFGLKILYKLVNETDGLMADRSYAPGSDMEALLRERQIPLWCWESRQPIRDFELVGFSLQYELTYTNVLNMLELAGIAVDARDRRPVFPLIFGGGPSSVNPEPMARFMDFFMIGDGELTVPHAMQIIARFKTIVEPLNLEDDSEEKRVLAALLRRRLLLRLAREVPGVYAPALYKLREGVGHATPLTPAELDDYLNEAGQLSELVPASLLEQLESEFPGLGPEDESTTGVPKRVFRQVAPLSDDNAPSGGLVSYLSLVHDREVLEVRRGCDRGCRFCQPGYTFLPVRERSADDILRLSKEGLSKSGHEEYSLLSLCVSDYTSLTETVRSLNREHSSRRTSLSFPSQRADRMNLDVAEELKVVRKSGITLAPEAGTERLRAVINKGLNHQQIISAIEAAYQSGWNSVKLYFMCCLPTERDEDLAGIIEILKEATMKCRAIRSADPTNHNRAIEFTCTISNFVPKPFTPFQWFGQVDRMETKRKHRVLRDELEKSGLQNVTLNTTDAEISLLESVISRGGREMGDFIHAAWKKGAIFDAWDDRFQSPIWHKVAEEFGTTLEALSCVDREVGSAQPWDLIHIGLHGWWLVKEWEKAVSVEQTPNCTENVCHACGVCTELDTNHELAQPSPVVMKKNPFVKELAAHGDEDSHPSLFFQKPQETPTGESKSRVRFQFTKLGDLRFISHLDLQNLFIRAARRAGLAMAYSQGFNPSPKLSLAISLPIFFESQAEVAELELAEPFPPDFQSRMNLQLPAEVQITEIVELHHKPRTSITAALNRATYRAVLIRRESAAADSISSTTEHVKERIQALLAEPSLLVTVPEKKSKKKKGKRYGKRSNEPRQRDIKPGIRRLELVEDQPATLELELDCGSEASAGADAESGTRLHVKPSEVLDLIDKDLHWRVTRLQLLAAGRTPLLNYDQADREASESKQAFELPC